MKLRNIEVGNLFLAPMAGVTDVGFRAVAKKYGASLTFTEMINARGLLRNSKKTEHLLFRNKSEVPMAVQLFGNDPQILAEAINHPLLKEFEVIDINMGCPAPKIIKNGEGSALLKDLTKAKAIIMACRNATNKPLTVKMRKGFYNNEETGLELAKICEECGVDAITIHGRTTSQMYAGNADYDFIKKVKQSVAIPVIANGDVFDKQSFEKILQTGADGVMIARGSLGNPWIFNELTGNKTKENRYQDIKQHVDILLALHPRNWVTLHMRKHFLWYTKNLEGANELRRKLAVCDNLEDGLSLLKQVIEG